MVCNPGVLRDARRLNVGWGVNYRYQPAGILQRSVSRQACGKVSRAGRRKQVGDYPRCQVMIAPDDVPVNYRAVYNRAGSLQGKR